jgi:predicted NAD/FAD-binding protein
MNILQGLDSRVPLCVTLNRSSAIRAETVLRRLVYEHPVFTTAAVAAQGRQREINGTLGSYYCGAYWRNGFHEDGVVSALRALDHWQEGGLDIGGRGHAHTGSAIRCSSAIWIWRSCPPCSLAAGCGRSGAQM